MYEQLTYRIIGCAMQVHKTIGSGFQEVIYQRALEVQMSQQRICFEREKSMDIFYGDVCIGNRRVDFFVENAVMVELKALTSLEGVHIAQTLNYLEVYRLPIALLINFGAPSLQFRRVYNTKIPNNQL